MLTGLGDQGQRTFAEGHKGSQILVVLLQCLIAAADHQQTHAIVVLNLICLHTSFKLGTMHSSSDYSQSIHAQVPWLAAKTYSGLCLSSLKLSSFDCEVGKVHKRSVQLSLVAMEGPYKPGAHEPRRAAHVDKIHWLIQCWSACKLEPDKSH